jgi:Bacterial self-protective colicin-like immunity
MGSSWASPSEVDPGSAIAVQLELMRDLVGGKIAGPDFARAWLSARRCVLNAGERLRERFDRVLADVFYVLDDYVIDSALRDSNDMRDEELVAKVRTALNDLDSLDVLRRSRGQSEGA